MGFSSLLSALSLSPNISLSIGAFGLTPPTTRGRSAATATVKESSVCSGCFTGNPVSSEINSARGFDCPSSSGIKMSLSPFTPLSIIESSSYQILPLVVLHLFILGPLSIPAAPKAPPPNEPANAEFLI